MKKKASDERDPMRPEYDFSKAVRGVTAARYARGANIVAAFPEVLRGTARARTRTSVTKSVGRTGIQ